MSAPKLLSSYLPYTFSNGVTIRRFAKVCRKCGFMLESGHMRGLATGDGDNLYIAAHAKCPHCRNVFSVCCVVTDNRQVVKVPFPVTIMKWWIRYSLKKRAAMVLKHGFVAPSADVEEETPPAPISLTHDEVTPSSEIIGRLGNLLIHEYFDYQELRYYFDRVYPENDKLPLAEQEQLFCEQLVYRHRDSTIQPKVSSSTESFEPDLPCSS